MASKKFFHLLVFLNAKSQNDCSKALCVNDLLLKNLSSRIIIMSILVIEDYQEDGSVKWILSFTNHNPEAKDCFQMIDAETAFRLKDYLTSCNDSPFNHLFKESDLLVSKKK